MRFLGSGQRVSDIVYVEPEAKYVAMFTSDRLGNRGGYVKRLGE